MRSPGSLLLLLSACLAVRANPEPTLPDSIQAQENFDLSRVRLASGVTVGSSWGRSCLPWGLPLPIWNPGAGPQRLSCSHCLGFGEATTPYTCYSMGLI